MSDATPADETEYWPIACPDCDHGTLEVSDAVYADYDTCDATVLRTEVGV